MAKKSSAKEKATSASANLSGKQKTTGRPRIQLDETLIMRLSECGCSVDEMAAMLTRSGLKIDRRTILRRLQEPDYREAWETGQLVGKATLRSQMFKLARMTQNPHVANQMCQFLARHWLNMSEKTVIEHEGRIDGQVEVTSARERVHGKIDAIAERIHRRVAGLAAAAGAKAPAGESV
jgi:hypothetical protein